VTTNATTSGLHDAKPSGTRPVSRVLPGTTPAVESPRLRAIVDYLHEHGPTTRRQITNALNIAWTTAYDWLTKLEEMGIVERASHYARGPGRRGRPRVYWFVSGDERAERVFRGELP